MIEEVLEKNPDVVVMVDEAYIDFGGETCLPLLEKYENLLVIRTFSKSRSLAGLRIGYAVGSTKMIKYLNDVKFSFNSYTLNYPTIHLGVESVKDDAYFVAMRDKLIATRERSKRALKELGFDFKDSMANFIFAKHETKSAEEIYTVLRERNIYVRYFKKPRIDNYLRITIGTDEQMDALVVALKEILGLDS
jgi:histidinol-phosphate aminotransferase